MKHRLKGKMVKTIRPKVDTSQFDCECLKCKWAGYIEDTSKNEQGEMLCPNCKDKVLID